MEEWWGWIPSYYLFFSIVEYSFRLPGLTIYSLFRKMKFVTYGAGCLSNIVYMHCFVNYKVFAGSSNRDVIITHMCCFPDDCLQTSHFCLDAQINSFTKVASVWSLKHHLLLSLKWLNSLGKVALNKTNRKKNCSTKCVWNTHFLASKLFTIFWDFFKKNQDSKVFLFSSCPWTTTTKWIGTKFGWLYLFWMIKVI